MAAGSAMTPVSAINSGKVHKMKDVAVTKLEAELDKVLAKLLADSNGSRTTLRIDDAARGWEVNFICAEALKPGVKSLRGSGSIDQRAAATLNGWTSTRKPDSAGHHQQSRSRPAAGLDERLRREGADADADVQQERLSAGLDLGALHGRRHSSPMPRSRRSTARTPR